MTWDALKTATAQRRTLGAPPTPASTIDNLAQPESIADRVDGRSLRATGRTAQLNIHVRPEFKQRVKVLAAQLGLLHAEILEQALDAFERQSASLPEITK